MGATGAMGMSEAVNDGLASLDQALVWHLQSNHYPPVPTIMVQVCKAAIEAAEDEDWDRVVELPDGVSYKGSDSAPAWAIVEQHHLDAFIMSEEY